MAIPFWRDARGAGCAREAVQLRLGFATEVPAPVHRRELASLWSSSEQRHCAVWTTHNATPSYAWHNASLAFSTGKRRTTRVTSFPTVAFHLASTRS
jgi:hypothetical protein